MIQMSQAEFELWLERAAMRGAALALAGVNLRRDHWLTTAQAKEMLGIKSYTRLYQLYDQGLISDNGQKHSRRRWKASSITSYLKIK
jgi:hypothetical protein